VEDVEVNSQTESRKLVNRPAVKPAVKPKVNLHAELRGRLARLTVSEVALLLGQKDTEVRKWIAGGMPTNPYSHPITCNWPDVLRWFVCSPYSRRIAKT
jgi:hypothetical protein